MYLTKSFQEISAGGVVLKKDSRSKRIKVAVIHRHDMNDWTIPKGHQNLRESLEETAQREVLEETGFLTIIDGYIGSFTYAVTDANKKVKVRMYRTVHWFLMSYKKGARIKPNREVSEVKWVPITSDFRFMSHKNDLGIIKKAKAILAKNVEFLK